MSGRDGFIEVEGYRIHYVEWGDKGSNIVLLHSMGMDAHSMDLLTESLGKEHRILALTILAHGDSSAPEKPVTLTDHAELMRACASRLGYLPCTLVGHSIGGRMSMFLTSEHPSDFRGVVLVDIVPPDPAPRPWSQQTPEPFKTRADAVAYLKQRYPRFVPEYVENRLRHGFTRQPDGSLKLKPAGNANMTSYSTDLWPYVERISVPVLLVTGSESTIATPEKITRMKGSVRGIEIITIQGASHMVPQDKPEEFERAVRGFLDRIKA